MSDESGSDPEDAATEDDWTLDYAGRAVKDVDRLDPPIRRRVLDALGKLVADPHGGQLRKLTGSPESRLRVGDWRVLVMLDEKTKTLQVVRVLPRGRAYDR
jgi:mRNA interferase RelE/StbE